MDRMNLDPSRPLPPSDSPPCVSEVIGTFVRSWNDALPDEDRDRLLKPILLRLPGTAGDKSLEARRSWLALDWLVRVHAPEFMSLVPALVKHAETLRGLPPQTSSKALAKSAAAGAAARAAAGAAARAAARAAAGAAARAALRPSVERLQVSAADLLVTLIELT